MGRKRKTAREAPQGGNSSPAPSSRPAKDLPALEEVPAGSIRNRKWLTAGILCVVVLAAGGLRMANLGTSPPGTLDDECVEIWNAYCMLKTGQDANGVRWPILSTRGQGDNRPTIFMYCLMPFLAVFGESVWSARFGAAFMGTLEVFLIYVTASRMLGRRAGLAAAVAMALCPWHLRNSRYAFMANSFFLTLPLAMLLLANLPLGTQVKGRPRPVLALVAGLVTGMCCYGYPSIRFFLPLFLLAAAAVNWRAWWELFRAESGGGQEGCHGSAAATRGDRSNRSQDAGEARDASIPCHPERPLPRWREVLHRRRGAVAIVAVLAGLAITLGPLAWAHIAHPERMGKRAQSIMVWKPTDSFSVKFGKAAERYLPHFGPEFLFEKGDGEEGRSVVRRVPGTGAFQWYLLPPMLAGLVLAVARLRSSPAARVLLAGAALYPVADLFFQAPGVHLYRALPGLPMLILLAAYGAAEGGLWLRRRWKPALGLAAGAVTLWAALWSVPFFQRFYVDYNRLPQYYECFEGGLVDAMRWLRPRAADAEGVFVSMNPFGFRSVYLIALVELGYEPRQWFDGPRQVHRDAIGGDLDWVSDFGKVHFAYDSGGLRAYWREGGRDGRDLPMLIYDLPAWKERRGPPGGGVSYLVVPPGYSQAPPPIYEVRRPSDGQVVLWVCEVRP